MGPRGRNLVRDFEQLLYTAYDDGTGVWTLGYGHTHGVKQGDTCTRAQAEAWLAEDLHEAEIGVDNLVKASMSEGMRDALVSFVYNLGAGALAKSELLQHVNSKHNFSAAKAFLQWSMAGGRPMRGLLRRRLTEAALYCADSWTE